MRLFEFAPDIDLGSIELILSNYVNRANEKKADIKIPFDELRQKLDQYDLPLGGPNTSNVQMLNALKNLVPRLSDKFDVDEKGYMIIKSETKPQVATGKGAGPSVDQMASSAAQQSLNSKF